jgi:hypothetical protein
MRASGVDFAEPFAGCGTPARVRGQVAMMQAMTVALALFTAGVAAANAASPPEEVAVNLIVGKCLSEKTGAAMPASAIDPAIVGTALTPQDRDPRLSKQALRIRSASGAVYYDHKEEHCLVHAVGVDNARTLASLQDALDRLGLKASKRNVRMRDAKDADDPSVMRIVAVYLIEMLASSDAMPAITITYAPAYPSILTAGVVVGRLH